MTANGSHDARAAGLRYSSDGEPGITRRRAGRGFTYHSSRGAPVRGQRQLARIRALMIPPAWSEVWICTDARGHLQATGRDARGRKQYLYHGEWRTLRDATKFDRMASFGATLPLVDETLIRVGSDEYRRANGSFGATTIAQRHARVAGASISVEFRGKGGKLVQAEVSDRRLARAIQRLHDLPGRELFAYLDDEGERHRVRSGDVNAYLGDVSSEDLTVKDFRTWGASALCMREINGLGAPDSAEQAQRSINETIHNVAGALGNTPAVCRASYIHPALLEAYAGGELPPAASRRLRGLDRWESALLRFLRANS